MNNLSIIGLPIFLLIVSIFSFIWFAIEVKIKRINFKAMFSWFVLNLIFFGIIIYVLVTSLLIYFGYLGIRQNIFNYVASKWFHLSFNGAEWIIILIMAFISYILIQTLYNQMKIAKINLRVDELNKQVAILSGKVNKTVDFSNVDLANEVLTSKEYKKKLKEEIKKKKAEIKANDILEDLNFEVSKKK